ncbi:hypothetical protein WR25_04066 [Diploscapter pachys]|uniref:FH2 domain-containing protein n=1 Tax=Diploscapter pachys TaxID=2018661 RepID=A0A2A2J568_9BILA|nr:hypothetical protein WR25_04066 [Diploscapter pachys]
MSTQPNSGGSGNRTEEATTAAAHTEMNEAKPATMDEILNRLANNVNPPTRTHSISSSVRSSVTQPVRPGENMQPRYLHTQICWSVLNEEQARATVFAELSTIENATEMFDGSLLTSPESPFILLSEDEAAKVASVRDKLKLQLFEVMFAVHSIARMDLTVLGPELVQLVAEIAPTSADEVRMRQFERVANDAPPLGENEQFLLALSKIDRLEEKLFVMQHMANFKQKTESIQESLNVLTEAAKSINSSASLKQLLQWILVLMNYFIGDKTGKSIRGFRTSQINEICSRTLHNGETILSLLATTINSDLHELKGAIDLLPAVNNASQEMFMELSTAVCRLEEGNILAERELEFASANNAPLTALAEFLEGARTQITQIFESLISSREELASMLLFFGEPVPRTEEPFHPEQFFFNLSSFLTSLQAALQPSESQSQSGKSDSDSTQDSPDSNAEPIHVTSP